MSALLAASGPSPLWFLTRGSGVVALLLLTAGLLLGVANSVGWKSDRWPRFLTAGLHRNITLLVLVFLTIHIVTAVADSFAPIGLKDAVIPFASRYRPVWLGLGALAFDFLLAIVVTSLFRTRVSHRAWKLLHWLSYAAWPVALLHGLGTGSDAKVGWMQFITVVCAGTVGLAVLWRLGVDWRSRTPLRAAAALATIGAGAGILVWAQSGPLSHGWAARAGTPRALLRVSSGGTAQNVSSVFLKPPFTASLRGTITQSPVDASGLVTVRVVATASGGVSGLLRLTLRGQSIAGGGVQLTASGVAFGPTSAPSAYNGTVIALDGQRVVARLTDGAGSTLLLDLRLTVDATRVGGTLSATAPGSDTG